MSEVYSLSHRELQSVTPLTDSVSLLTDKKNRCFDTLKDEQEFEIEGILFITFQLLSTFLSTKGT